MVDGMYHTVNCGLATRGECDCIVGRLRRAMGGVYCHATTCDGQCQPLLKARLSS